MPTKTELEEEAQRRYTARSHEERADDGSGPVGGLSPEQQAEQDSSVAYYRRTHNEDGSLKEGGGGLQSEGDLISVLGDGLDALGLNAAKDRARADAARKDALAEWNNLYDVMPRELATEDAADQDQFAIRQQREALLGLSNAAQGRYSDIDRARQNEIQQRNAMQERGQREAALSQMQARGMGRSGTALTASLMAGQQGANRNSAEAQNLEALAQQRALQAMNSQAAVGGQMRSATEEFNRRNVDRRNQDAQQKFENYRSLAAGKTGQYNSAAEASDLYARGAAAGLGGIVESVFD